MNQDFTSGSVPVLYKSSRCLEGNHSREARVGLLRPPITPLETLCPRPDLLAPEPPPAWGPSTRVPMLIPGGVVSTG